MRRLLLLVPSLLLAACSSDRGPWAPPASGPPQASALSFQAVDVGTGSALVDPRMTVRWLVRTPITLDASAVEEVAATEPYEITRSVGSDSLVVEVRLEAPSYLRLDTALTVQRGGSVGPLTLRMTRRLDRAASNAGPTGARPGAASQAAVAPAPTTSAAEGTSAADAARQRELVDQAVAAIDRGEYAGALDLLDEAVGLGIADPVAHLRLAQVQCAVGRVDEGRTTLGRMEGIAFGDPGKLPLVQAYALYGQGLCTQQEFMKVRAGIELARVGGKAVRELEAFLQAAEKVPSPPPELQRAVTDARERIEEIRERARRGAIG